MQGLNQVIVIGNLGKDPELKGSDGNVLSFSIAVTERRKSTDGEWKDALEWVPVTVFGKRAAALEKILSKGTRICARGRFVTRSWETDAGEKRRSTSVVADDIILLDGKVKDETPGTASSAEQFGTQIDNLPF
jgi:single-strand DNA-binding protein